MLILLVLLGAGCRSHQTLRHVTCKPQLELAPAGLVTFGTIKGEPVVEPKRQTLVLSDGAQDYRLFWGIVPFFPEPAVLDTNQTYTFTIQFHKVLDMVDQPFPYPRVVRIEREQELVYEARDEWGFQQNTAR